MKIYIAFLISTFIVLLTSCDKHHAKKLAGTYSCTVEYHYWDISPTLIDSMYTEDINIEQDGKFIVVLGTRIHVDSLWKEKEYSTGHVYNYIKVLFKNDRVYITRTSGGLGGGASRSYEGNKK